MPDAEIPAVVWGETYPVMLLNDAVRLSYPADHPLADKFEEQMVNLVRQYLGDGEYVSVHHPKDDPSGRDDYPDSTALALLAAKNGGVGDIVVLDQGFILVSTVSTSAGSD